MYEYNIFVWVYTIRETHTGIGVCTHAHTNALTHTHTHTHTHTQQPPETYVGSYDDEELSLPEAAGSPPDSPSPRHKEVHTFARARNTPHEQA